MHKITQITLCIICIWSILLQYYHQHLYISNISGNLRSNTTIIFSIKPQYQVVRRELNECDVSVKIHKDPDVGINQLDSDGHCWQKTSLLLSDERLNHSSFCARGEQRAENRITLQVHINRAVVFHGGSCCSVEDRADFYRGWTDAYINEDGWYAHRVLSGFGFVGPLMWKRNSSLVMKISSPAILKPVK